LIAIFAVAIFLAFAKGMPKMNIIYGCLMMEHLIMMMGIRLGFISQCMGFHRESN
jgi:hypothetical protein